MRDDDSTRVRAAPEHAETAVRRPAPDGGRTLVRGTGEIASVAPLQPGDCIRRRYLLEEKIGSGAMGQVWRARDQLAEEARHQRPFVAVKVLNDDFADHPDAFVGLHREATRAQQLAHPNIVTVHIFDRDETTGRIFIAMELLEGRPLDAVIREVRGVGLSAAKALPLIVGLADGLAYAHRRGIVHSDFKPANVFVLPDDTPKVLDFGIARGIQAVEGKVFRPIDDGVFTGYTPAYAAPDVLAGADPHPADDVFSLGIVAYEMLSGEHPFLSKQSSDAKQQGIRPKPLKGLRSREARVIQRALSFERADRFETAAEFRKALHGTGRLQVMLIATGLVLAIATAALSYRNYLASGPDVPFDKLPASTQQAVRKGLADGREALQYIERTREMSVSEDAVAGFASVLDLHSRNREAVAGLEDVADLVIDWYLRQPDRAQALEQMRIFEQKAQFYRTYAPLQEAIESLERPP